MKRLPPGMELDRLIFLARMGGGKRLRAQTSGTIEVTEESVNSVSNGPSEAGGWRCQDAEIIRLSLGRRGRHDDTMTLDQFTEMLHRQSFEEMRTEPGVHAM